jgi:ATP-dependent protease ClpP protease subunit
VEIQDRAQPIVATIGDVDEAGSRRLSEEVSRARTTGQTGLPVVIDSFGGDAYSLAGMLATLDAATLPVVTIVESKAMSCGAILFAAGSIRIAAPTATFLIHDVSSSVDGKTDDIKVDAKETERLQAILFQRLDCAAGKKPGTSRSSWIPTSMRTSTSPRAT